MQPTTQTTFIGPKNPLQNLAIIFPAQRNFPFLTILFGILASAVTFSPQITSWLQFDRTAILHGETWRILTGHLTHWSASHLFWDILVFLVLAGSIEWFSRRQLLTCFTAGSLIISLLVLTLLPEMVYYRGLSGIDSGLFMLLLVLLYCRYTTGHSLLYKTPYILLGLLFVGKSVFELLTAQALFVESAGLFIPVPLAHLGGAFVGGIIGVLHSKRHI
jgi:rhomboid family GlyGly-CTERM serine protease